MLLVHAAVFVWITASCPIIYEFPPNNSTCELAPVGWTNITNGISCAAASYKFINKDVVNNYWNNIDPIGCFYIPSRNEFGFNGGQVTTNPPLCGPAGTDCIEVCNTTTCTTAVPDTAAPATEAPATSPPPTPLPATPFPETMPPATLVSTAAPPVSSDTPALPPGAVYPPLGGVDETVEFTILVGAAPIDSQDHQQPPSSRSGHRGWEHPTVSWGLEPLMLLVHAAVLVWITASCPVVLKFPPNNSTCKLAPVGWTIVINAVACGTASVGYINKPTVNVVVNSIDPIGCFYIPSLHEFGYNDGQVTKNSPLCGPTGTDCIEVCNTTTCTTAVPDTAAPATEAPATSPPPTPLPATPFPETMPPATLVSTAAPPVPSDTPALPPGAVYPPLGGVDETVEFTILVGAAPIDSQDHQQPPSSRSGNGRDGSSGGPGMLLYIPSMIVVVGAVGLVLLNRKWRG
ncbi:hypothetical protein DIPPA_24653 [Diplonema papillatum]|nr:hypothetical protein DIPPA_24653 [Diplonema papillatum]